MNAACNGPRGKKTLKISRAKTNLYFGPLNLQCFSRLWGRECKKHWTFQENIFRPQNLKCFFPLRIFFEKFTLWKKIEIYDASVKIPPTDQVEYILQTNCLCVWVKIGGAVGFKTRYIPNGDSLLNFALLYWTELIISCF